MRKKIVVLHQQILTDKPDELDVISQRDLVLRACENLGFKAVARTFGRTLLTELEALKADPATLVFNLAESAWGKGELIYFVPAVLNSLRIPYTGVPLDALFLTTSKVLSKRIMRQNDIPTPDFFSTKETAKLDPGKTYLLKPIWEEASVGIDEDSLFSPEDKKAVERIIQLPPSHYFIEEFVDGREFNISVIAGGSEPEVLPPAEMIFSSYFQNKPRIVGYKAKWDEASEEFKQTARAFNTLVNEPELERELKNICLNIWKVFGLKGYVRVDFRVDHQGRVYVLEINGNPCISPDSGFVAANKQAGYTVNVMIDRILKDANGI